MEKNLLRVKEVTFEYYKEMRSLLGIAWDAQENVNKAYGRITNAIHYADFRSLCEDVAGRYDILRVSFKIKDGMGIPPALSRFISSGGRWVKIPSPRLGGVMDECVECSEAGSYLSVKLRPTQTQFADYEIDFEHETGGVRSVAAIIPVSELDIHGWDGLYSLDVRALWVPPDAVVQSKDIVRDGYLVSQLFRQRLAGTRSQRSPLLEQHLAQASLHSRERRSEEDSSRLEQIASSGGRKVFWVKR